MQILILKSKVQTDVYTALRGRPGAIIAPLSYRAFFIMGEIMNPVTQIREARGITRKELAQRSGISYPTLSALEYGMPLTMASRTAGKLADFGGLVASQVMESYAEWRESLSSKK